MTPNALVLVIAGLAGFLKGQLHAHTNRSGDGTTAPAEVARWYREHGYDFVVLTDHERITSLPNAAGLLVLPGVELTQNLETCEPPPRAGSSCLLHVNALIVEQTPEKIPWSAPGSLQRFDRYVRALDVTSALGGVAQLNHPNFHRAADAALIERLVARGLTMIEIANGSSDVDNTPAGEPSTEAIWDAVLSRGVTVWGTATDDAHHFYDAAARAKAGEPVYTGEVGFVMVRAEKTAGGIRRALVRGDFYSSNGVLLQRLTYTGQTLELAVAASAKGDHVFRFIGSNGRLLHTAKGRRARVVLSQLDSPYVRVVIDDAAGRHAWTQPFFIRR